MALDEEQKKHLLYGAGAVASIIGLVYIFGRNKTSAMPSYPAAQRPATSASGGGSSAAEAAQIQAATALTVAQTQKEIALAQIAASTENTRTIANAQTSAARSAASGSAARAAFSPGGAGTAAATGLFDFLKKLAPGLFGQSETGDGSMSAIDQLQLARYQEYLNAPNYQNNLGESVGGFVGDFLDPSSSQNASWYVEPATYGDYYQGSTGSGDSGWFGSSPSDPNSWQNFEGFSQPDTSWQTFEGFSQPDTSWQTFEGFGSGE